MTATHQAKPLPQYIIVETATRKSLEKRVNEKITEGFAPWGGHVVTHDPQSNYRRVLYQQAMISTGAA